MPVLIIGFQVTRKLMQNREKEGDVVLLLAEEQYKNARVSYENDLLTRGELLGSEAAVVQAEIEFLSAELDYLTGGKVLRSSRAFFPIGNPIFPLHRERYQLSCIGLKLIFLAFCHPSSVWQEVLFFRETPAT